MRKVWKILRYLFIGVVGFLLLDLLVIFFFSFYRPQIKNADAIVILGAAINTPALYNRSLEGLRLYQQGRAGVIVLSGGQDFAGAQTESAYMEKVITANSPQPAPLILEDQSQSTYENLKNSMAKLGGEKSIIIVSDGFHLARAVITAKRLGLNPVYWSAPEPTYYSKKDLAYYYLREVFAMISYIPKFIVG